MIGINKNSATGSVPAESTYISTYNSTNGGLSLGRGANNGLPSTSDLFISTAGNVGIGTTSPSAALQVSGQIVTTLATTMTPTGTTQTVNFANGNMQMINLGSATGTVTVTFTNPVPGGSYAIQITQGTTPRVITWPASVKWPNGVTMTLTATANAVDLITFFYNGTNFLAVGGQNFL